MAQPHQAGHYEDDYGHQGEGYYQDEQNQAYYEHNNQGGYAQPAGEGYYDERYDLNHT